MQLNGHRSGWTEVSSVVPQESVLGPLFCTIFIDDIDEEVLCNISKFSDDTKYLAERIDKLVAWENRWVLDFNVNNCGVMHIGKSNLEFQYQMNNGWVKSIDEEKDLGVLMFKDLKFSNNISCRKIKLI